MQRFELVFTVALWQEIPVNRLKSLGYPVCSLASVQSGYLDGHSFIKGVLFLVTGVGRRCSQEAAFFILDRIKPLYVVNLGSAGVLNRSFDIGSWVLPASIRSDEKTVILSTPLPFKADVFSKGCLVSSEVCFDGADFIDQEAFYQASIFEGCPDISFHCLKYLTDFNDDSLLNDFNSYLSDMSDALFSFLPWLSLTLSSSDISVVIPTYNRALLLKRSVRSVLSQTSQPSHIIVVNDGSTDDTLSVLTPYIKSIYLINSLVNQGVSCARNRALMSLQTDWVCFLDSDDLWASDKLEKQCEYLSYYPFYLWMQSDENWIYNGEEKQKKSYHQKKSGWLFFESLERCMISPSSVLIHRDLFDRFGFFREDFKACEDYDLWLKMSRYFPVGFDPTVSMTKFAGHSGQLSYDVSVQDDYRVQSLYDLYASEFVVSFKKRIKTVLLLKLTILIKGGLKRAKNVDYYQSLLEELNQDELFL